jgi:microsomal dipeptidase-like Zn-dependent dipeptidase
MPLPPAPFIVDTHEDIGWHCLEHGRDFVNPGSAACMIALPWLQACGMRLICATLFTIHGEPAGERHWKLYSQWEMYQELFQRYPRALLPVLRKADLTRLAGLPPLSEPGDGRPPVYPIGVILLMEGLDLLGGPAELQTWFERGLRMASLTWYGNNHFASGTAGDRQGLKPLGAELIREFERLGLIFDLAHLNDAGISDVFSRFPELTVCASHSNSRTITPHERNLTDDQAREIARRGGVIGLNLLGNLIRTGWHKGDPQPPLSAATDHPLYLARLLGPQYVGIGADLDGGLTPDNTPLGIDRIDHLPLLGADLRARGMSEEQVAGFMGGNWWHFFERCLPD